MESFDQGVENPFKNPGLMSSEEGMKIDPARLLGPRLNGSNLYLIGMMGTGKSTVGNIVARRVRFPSVAAVNALTGPLLTPLDQFFLRGKHRWARTASSTRTK
jgi:hypothetical protein